MTARGPSSYAGLAAVAIAATASAGVLRADEATRLDIRWSPIIDLHFHARVAAASQKAPPAELAPLMDAVRKVNDALGRDLRSWGLIEGALYGCSTAADVRTAFSDFPERFTLRSPRGDSSDAGKEVELRRLALEFADALGQVEPTMTGIREDDERVVAQARATVAERLGPKEAACLKYMIEHLGPEDPKIVISVYLVADMPWPGAVTQLRPARAGGICFVAVRDVEPLQLIETILHESTHALDVVWKEDATLDHLRSKLQAAGPSVDQRDLHDVPHTLMFVHAGETVRRNIDPNHQHYGDVSGYYARLSRATQAVRGPWVDYLDGKASREEALDRIVRSLAPAGGSP